MQSVPPGTSWHPPNQCHCLCSANGGPGARGCQRSSETTFFAINKFLDECDSALIPISGVMDEVPKFQETWRTLELAVGSEWLLVQKSPCSLQTGTLGCFHDLCWQHSYIAAETCSVLRDSRRGKPIPGGIPIFQAKRSI